MSTLPQLTLCAVLAFTAHAFAGKSHDHAPKHGGIVVEAHDIDYELVIGPMKIELYARDHDKALDLSRALGRVTLLNGNQKQDIQLASTAGRLEAVGVFDARKGTKVVAEIVRNGKTTIVRARLSK
jgi:hypothetical protein